MAGPRRLAALLRLCVYNNNNNNSSSTNDSSNSNTSTSTTTTNDNNNGSSFLPLLIIMTPRQVAGRCRLAALLHLCVYNDTSNDNGNDDSNDSNTNNYHCCCYHDTQASGLSSLAGCSSAPRPMERTTSSRCG